VTPVPGKRTRATVSAARRGVRLTVWRTSLRGLLRSGLRVSVRVPNKGKLVVLASQRRRTLARRTARPRHAGTRRMRLVVRHKARPRLRRARRVRITIAARHDPAGRRPPIVVRVRLTVRR
jgi:hypothetical protein